VDEADEEANPACVFLKEMMDEAENDKESCWGLVLNSTHDDDEDDEDDEEGDEEKPEGEEKPEEEPSADAPKDDAPKGEAPPPPPKEDAPKGEAPPAKGEAPPAPAPKRFHGKNNNKKTVKKNSKTV
jgi:hypothetical protein